MPAVSLKTFNGELPKEAKHLLPNTNAQLALNCNFADGTLRPHRGGSLLQTMVNNPVKGIYTEDGLLFYTWPVETLAFKSPILGDAYNRIYFLTPSVGELRVTTKAGMGVNGPQPGSSWKVGVPRPETAPALRLVDRATLPDYPNIAVTIIAWWDYGGEKHSETTVAATTVSALRAYSFTPPALPAEPPEGFTEQLVARLKFSDLDNAGAVIMDVVVKAGATSRSNSFPGSVEVSLDAGAAGVLRLQWGAEDARAYTYTYQNTWEEEGAPAPPATISPTYVQDVEATVYNADFTGYRPFDKFQIYRTFGGGTTYLRTTVTGSAPVFTDASRRPGAAGLPLESTDFYPPQAGLEGLELMPGGWFIAFKDNRLFKTFPYRPYAWAYEETFATNIRGVRASQSGAVVTTADGVSLVPGGAPGNVGTLKLDAPQPGISQRSMTGVEGATAYVSNDGLVLVSGSMATLQASQRLFTREKWREFYDEIIDDASIRLAYHDGSIVASSNTQAKGFILRLDEGVGNFSRFNERMDCMFQLPVNDALYYSVGANVYRFDDGAALTFDWWSKDFVYGHDQSVGAYFIRCDGPVTVTVYADGAQWQQRVVTTGFHRVAPIRAHRWSFRLSGAATVHELAWAQTMLELKNA